MSETLKETKKPKWEIYHVNDANIVYLTQSNIEEFLVSQRYLSFYNWLPTNNLEIKEGPLIYNIRSVTFDNRCDIDSSECTTILKGCVFNDNTRIQSYKSVTEILDSNFYSSTKLVSHFGNDSSDKASIFTSSTFAKELNILIQEDKDFFANCSFNGVVSINSQSGTIVFENCTFYSLVDCSEWARNTNISFRNCTFKGYVALRSDSKSTLEFSHCTFNGGINLEWYGTARFSQNKYTFGTTSYLLKKDLPMNNTDLLCGRVGTLLLENDRIRSTDAFPMNRINLELDTLFMNHSSFGKESDSVIINAGIMVLKSSQIEYQKRRFFGGVHSQHLWINDASKVNGEMLLPKTNLLPTGVKTKTITLLDGEFPERVLKYAKTPKKGISKAS